MVTQMIAAVGFTDTRDLFKMAIDVMDVADRVDYVAKVRSLNDTNLADLFPEWAGSECSCKRRDLVVESVAQDVSNAGQPLDKVRVTFVQPAGFDSQPAVSTDWLSEGWVPAFVAERARELIGLPVRAWWRTFQIDSKRTATELVWIEAAGGVARAQPAPAAAPRQRQEERQDERPRPKEAERPYEVADAETTKDILDAIQSLTMDRQDTMKAWIVERRYPPVRRMNPDEAAATLAFAFELQAIQSAEEEPF